MLIQCPSCSSRYNASIKIPGEFIHCRCGTDFHIPDLPNIARSWNCPNCGGSANPSKNKCDYCEAYLAFARCPACFSIAPYNEAKHCAECGESLTLPIKLPPQKNSQVPCPRCDNFLLRKIIDKHAVDICNDCGGLWLEHQHLNNILSDEPLNTTAILGKLPTLEDTSKLPRHRVSYLACPDCNDMMSRHNFMQKSNIILDQCNNHGIWFDKYELAAALNYLRSRPDRPVPMSTTSIKNGISTSLKDHQTNRDEAEVFEINDEDLQVLLEEFPEWRQDKQTK